MHLFVVNLIMQDLFEYFSEICRNCILLWVTEYLGLTLVFMSNSALGGNFNCYFLGLFG